MSHLGSRGPSRDLLGPLLASELSCSSRRGGHTRRLWAPLEQKLNPANASPLEKLSAQPGGHSEKEVTDWPTVGRPGKWDAPGDEPKAGPREKRAHASDRRQGRCTDLNHPQAVSAGCSIQRHAEIPDLTWHCSRNTAFSSLPAPHKRTPVSPAPPPATITFTSSCLCQSPASFIPPLPTSSSPELKHQISTTWELAGNANLEPTADLHQNLWGFNLC